MMPPDATPLKEITFAAFDLETTGMDPIKDRIVEIGTVIFREREVKETLEYLVNPGISMPQGALDIHGIDDAMLRDQPALREILPALLEILSQTILVAHNAPFDLSFLLEAAALENLPFSPSPVVDTCQMAREAYPKLSNHRLQSLVKEFQLDSEQSHRALGDARSCFSLFCRVVEGLPLKWETPWADFQTRFSGVFSANFGGLILPAKLSPFEKALQDRKRLLVSYKDGQGQVTKREVTPMSITRDDRKRMVMLGYCHLRQGTRTFRLDRILEIQLTQVERMSAQLELS